MNTENHAIPEIPENSLCLLRFAAQTPCTKGNRAAMAALNAYALTLPWEGATPLVCIKQEVVYLTSAYVAQATEPEPVEWHNPDNLSDDIVKSGDGWRLLLKDEVSIPLRTQFYHYLAARWVESLAKTRMHDVTYRTFSPLPKPACK